MGKRKPPKVDKVLVTAKGPPPAVPPRVGGKKGQKGRRS